MTSESGQSKSTQSAWVRYERKIKGVIDHIHKNPAGDLGNDRLAEVACLSSFHWHRIYRSVTGEAASSTVRRSRMTHATGLLIRSDKVVREVGIECGYPDVHSFSRTFKSYFGIAPAAFRELHRLNNDSPAISSTTNSENSEAIAWHVELIDRPELVIGGLWHRGDYLAIGTTFEKLGAISMLQKWNTATPYMSGYYLDDPNLVQLQDLRSFAALTISHDQPGTDIPLFPDSIQSPGVDHLPTETCEYWLPHASYAKIIHRGPYILLENAYRWLYNSWLPAAGREMADIPCNENYLNSPIDTAPDDLVTEICLPLQYSDPAI